MNKKKKDFDKVKLSKSVTFWVILVIFAILFYNSFVTQLQPGVKRLSYTEFIKQTDSGKVKKVEIRGNEVKGEFMDSIPFITYIPDDPNLMDRLLKNKVEVTVKPLEQVPWWLNAIVTWLPVIILFSLIFLSARQIQGGAGAAFSFGKSRAKLMTSSLGKVTFDDVAGVDEAKEELKEIIEFLKDPQKFQKLGGRIPKGVLLLGPPGSGKTLLARAVAGEAGVPFFSISGSDFVEMFVGVGASRVRDLFEQGKKQAPCIIFIDELDAVGRHRGAGLGGGHDEREQTLNQLLVEMDGFDVNTGVILIAATNRPDVLDPALLRPGRFDRNIIVDNPDVVGREGILKVHTRKIPLAPEIDLKVIARGTPGFSGADLANLVNESALLAARRDKKNVEMTELEEAKDRVMMGPERKSRIIGEREKKSTAFHEAGHALVSKLIPGAEPIHKVTIIPRGRSLGSTHRLPIEDRYNRSKAEFLNDITILLGGRAAEELILNELTTGARNDLEIATDVAHKMVCEYGMSDELGPRTFGKRDQEIFIGRDLLKEKNYSEDTSKKIDEELRKIIDTCHERAKVFLKDNKEKLIKLANTLLEKEVLDGAEVDKILADGQEKN